MVAIARKTDLQTQATAVRGRSVVANSKSVDILTAPHKKTTGSGETTRHNIIAAMWGRATPHGFGSVVKERNERVAGQAAQ